MDETTCQSCGKPNAQFRPSSKKKVRFNFQKIHVKQCLYQSQPLSRERPICRACIDVQTNYRALIGLPCPEHSTRREDNTITYAQYKYSDNRSRHEIGDERCNHCLANYSAQFYKVAESKRAANKCTHEQMRSECAYCRECEPCKGQF